MVTYFSICAQEPVRKYLPASGPEFFSLPFLMRIVEKLLIAAGSFCAWTTASVAENQFHSDANQVILSLLPQMPKQGGYSASNAATANLQTAVRVSSGRLTINPRAAVPSYCSGATYLVFVQAVEKLNGGAPIASPLAEQLAVKGQPDGVGVWGRWNANGPGTACLFRELDLGPNFTSWNAAKPGDFMKIFWNPNVGRHEHGHSAIFLGVTHESGVEMVQFWSSNIMRRTSSVLRTRSRPRTSISAVWSVKIPHWPKRWTSQGGARIISESAPPFPVVLAHEQPKVFDYVFMGLLGTSDAEENWIRPDRRLP